MRVKESEDFLKSLEKLRANRIAQATDSLNTILYGPPGTGKTYATFSKCVEICDGVHVSGEDDISERYKDLCEEGRIEFVTFHQSYSYEEFVEGLRPYSEGGGEFRLEPRKGVIRRIAKRARSNTGQSVRFSH